MARPRSDSPPARRDEVVEIAARIFHAKGYEATTIRDIADAAGLLKGSVYHYIPSKQDALFDIVRAYHDETRVWFEAILQSDEPCRERLWQYVATGTAYNARHVVRSSLFFTEWRALREEHREIIIAERDRHDRFVQDSIAEGQRHGIFRAEINARVAAYGILGMTNSLYRWYQPEGAASAEEIGEQYAEMVLNGLSRAPS